MFRIFASVLVVLPLAAPLAAQTDYTWNPATTGAEPVGHYHDRVEHRRG